MTRLAAALAAFFAPVPVFAQEYGWNGHPHMGGYDGLGMIFGPVIWLIVLGLIVVGVVWAVRTLMPEHGPGPRPHAGTDPMEVLRARYAKGEIDTAEFEERKGALGG